MEARLRSWWQQIKQHRVAIGVGAIVVIVVIALIIASYLFDWTGFNGYNKVTITHTISGTNAGTVTRTEEYQPGKALWDWLQLFIIPFALAIIAIFFNRAERKNEQRITSDNQQEAALQAYINEMSLLLLEKHLREAKEGDEVRTIARVRTLTILPRLDSKRKRSVIQFLYESGLIEKGKSIINLSLADLSSADLRGAQLLEVSLREAYLREADLSLADLSEADLDGVNLIRANLYGAILEKADLSMARLKEANLSFAILTGAVLSEARLDGANLSFAILTGADLSNAQVTAEQLTQAKSLEGAIMPHGSIHP